MKNFRTINRLIASFLTILLLALPLVAQQRRSVPKRPAAAPEPAPGFDSLLAADSYKVYCEVRGVGGLIHSPAVNDLLDPVIKLGGPPKEFTMLVKWLGAHADALGGSRMLIAGWPSRPKLPTVIIAIEFSSPEEAKKFYPELRDFLPKFLPTPTPTPTPTPEPTPKVSPSPSETQVMAQVVVPIPKAEKEPEPSPPYQMKQAGSLVFISDIAFTFGNLRPPGSKGLEEDQNFLVARNRFSSESLFLYVDLKSIEKEENERRQKWEEEAQQRAEAEAANPPKDETLDAAAVEVPPEMDPVPPPSDLPAEEPAELVATVNPPDSSTTTPSDTTSEDHVDMTPVFSSLYGALFGGKSKWPEAVGAALVFENDAYVVRTLILNGAENKSSAIPFVPQFVSGPAITPEASGIFPADVDLFVSVSLDYPQIYEGMLKAFADSQEMMRKDSGRKGQPVTDFQEMESPFAIYEKKLGIKLKDDLLPLLGNELALALPKKAKKAANEPAADARDGKQSPADAAQNNANAGPNPIVAIGVKDREAVGRLIPKLIESFGLKGANLLAQTERRDGTELVSYAGAFAYAFVGDFLVVSPDTAEVRHVVDAYLNHQTLSSDSHFRNYTRWQARQVLGQLYVAPSLIEESAFGGISSGTAYHAKITEFLSGVNPVIDPLTYSLSNDGLGPLHELHMPKNLLQVLVAGMMVGASEGAASSNEAVTQSMVRTTANAEVTFKATEGNGSYASLDQLASAGLVSKETFDKYGYRIEVLAAGNKFEITAVPIEYGKTGKVSYFIDETQILRGGDHGGGAATLADEPMD
ncbi:MAG TPA: DUF3352 domain-containing protein [Pyrinomonadaceae bacterium]|jgi:hypothetical protein|nr:DUF3352 domain-containing protein [Pyrinomonadaceae bacterium]